MTKTNIKKALSVFLSVLMVLSCWVWVAPEETHIHADAAVAEKGKVAFYVPEVIYLYPEARSTAQATATPFQYYVENTVNTSSIYTQPTTNTELKSSGTVYFAAADGFSDVVISTRFTDVSGNTISGGSVSVGAFSNKTSYGTFAVSGGTSPSLAAATTGCYLEWTVTYTNGANERQSAIAYTYIYKPYIFPVAAGTDAGTGSSGGANWAGHVTWISGIHSITPVSTSQGNSFDESWFNIYTKENFASFISKDKVGYVNGTRYESGSQAKITSGFTTNPSSTGGSLGYAVFAGTSSTGYWLEVRGNANPAYLGVSSANSNTPPSGTYNFSVAKYRGNKKDIQTAVYEKSYGNLYIDTSRYSNLNQIPNLAVGMMVTDDEESAGGSGNWYVADFTGKPTDYFNKWYEGSDNSSTLYNDRGTVIAAQSNGNYDRSYDETEGIRYAGVWPKALTGETKINGKTAVYRVKGFYANWDKSWGNNYDAQGHTLCEMKATYYDKDDLRTAVNDAINVMGTLGLKDNYGSYYYDTNSTAWQNFKTAYMNAAKGLTKLDGAVDVSGLVTALNNAVNALKAGQSRKIYFDVNHDGINPNLYVLGNVTDGGYGLTVSYNADESITLNGTISGSNDFGKTAFTPKIGNYTFSSYLISGSKTGDGCVVLDSSKDDGSNISTRTNFDFSGNGEKSNSYDNTKAGETDFLRFWQWKSTQNDVYSNLKFRIKVEEGTSKTAYSPAARFATASGTYGTLPTLSANERTGYTFGGWSTTKDGTTAINKDTQITSDTLYAIWTPITYSLVFNGNGNTGGSMANQTLKYDEAANINANVFVKTGYSFRNWTTAQDGSGTVYSDNQSVKNLASVQGATINLWAQWTENQYMVEYNANGGTGTVNAQNPKYTDTFNIANNEFSKTGHTFKDWNTAADGNGTSYGAGQSVSKLTAENGATFKMYAQWDANKYTIAFDSNGGNGTMASMDMTYGVQKTLSSNAFSFEGYNFAGWNTNADGSGTAYSNTQSVSNLTAVNGDTVTLYAQWTKKTYTITWTDADDNVLETDTVDHGTVPTFDGEDPTKISDDTYHYDFIGWNQNVVAATANVTYKAVFDKNVHVFTTHTDKDDTYHTDKCACGYTKDVEHSYNAGEVTTKPTCTTDGVKTYTCSLCGGTKTEAVSMTGHTPVTDAAVAPGCVNTGLTEGKHCEVCGEVLVAQNTVAALGHTAAAAVEEKRVESTCTVAGSYDSVVYCSVCNAELSRDTVALELAAHTPAAAVEEDKVESTCTVAGSYDEVVYCSVCNAELSREKKALELAAHTEGAVVVENEVDATCTKEGSYDNVVYCTVCNAELDRDTVTVDKIAHDYETTVTPPTCTADGYTTYVCSACGDTYTDDETTALGHTAATAVEENRVESTCTVAGSYESVVYCSVCNVQLSRDTV
ncbi:MAG: InlB B-repeat-containing protein, partial [Clostridia bacterium]|nr:InlB B-repeat-containing protein [Clostridia bacterium]